MERRDVLRALGATAALSFLPRNASAVWALANARVSPALVALTPAQGALINAIADTIIPRTDTPGATDVNVLAWIDVVVADYYTDEEKATFLAGLDAIDAYAKTNTNATVADLKQDGRDNLVGMI